MLTNLEVEAAVSSEDVFAMLGASCQPGKPALSGKRQVATARRRSHALD